MNDILTVKQADYLNDYKLIIHNPTQTLVTVVILSNCQSCSANGKE